MQQKRLSLLAGIIVSLMSPKIALAQGTVRIHSFVGGVELYTGSTTLGFFKSGDPEEHFFSDALHPGTIDLEPGKQYRLVLVIAGDLTGTKCTATNPSGQQYIGGPANHDTVDVHVDVEFKFCGYRVQANYAGDDTSARGTVHFHANQSWISSFSDDGEPGFAAGGALDFTCQTGDLDCVEGANEDKAVAYNTSVSVTYTPGGQHTRVSGRNPFTGANFVGAPGEVVTLSGTANKELDFTDIYFSTARSADGSIALTSSSVQDTVVTGTFRVHNAGPDSTAFYIFAQGNTVVRAGSGHVAKIEITTPQSSCVQLDEACAALILESGASADVIVKTTTARLGDGSSAAVGANSCGTITIYGFADDSHTSDNSVSCVSGTSTPVTVSVSNGGTPPASQTVAVGSTNVPVIQFEIAPTIPVTLSDITLSASGSGNDQIDITAVKLYVDANANGVVDSGDAPIANGAFGSNNGTVTLVVTPSYTISAPTSFLVSYDFNTTLASRFGGVLVLAGLIPLTLAPRKRRRGVASALLLASGLGVASLGLGACGSDSTGPNPPNGSSATFSATLTGVTASGTAVGGVSVGGATITIAK